MNETQKQAAFLVTCEHGGNRIPPHYRSLFSGHDDLLNSHWGYDPGALVMARELAHQLHAPLIYSTVSRLLVDLNRSPRHPRLHAECVRRLPFETRRRIVERHYLPFRTKALAVIAAAVAEGKSVVHLSCHSFTPVRLGVERNADVGLLYDPSRKGETTLCKTWLACIRAADPTLRVRRNYPYAGKSNSFTSYLRLCFPADVYTGVELEINHSIVFSGRQAWRQHRTVLIGSLTKALAGCNESRPLLSASNAGATPQETY